MGKVIEIEKSYFQFTKTQLYNKVLKVYDPTININDVAGVGLSEDITYFAVTLNETSSANKYDTRELLFTLRDLVNEFIVPNHPQITWKDVTGVSPHPTTADTYVVNFKDKELFTMSNFQFS